MEIVEREQREYPYSATARFADPIAYLVSLGVEAQLVEVVPVSMNEAA